MRNKERAAYPDDLPHSSLLQICYTDPMHYFLLLLLSVPALAQKSSPLVNQVSRSRFEVSRKAIEKNLNDPVAQLSTFRFRPASGSGFLSGIKVSQFGKGCLLPQFGIKDGDILEMVNGQPLTGPGDIMEVGEKLAKARPGAKIRVNLRRMDEDVIQTYLLVE